MDGNEVVQMSILIKAGGNEYSYSVLPVLEIAGYYILSQQTYLIFEMENY
jgi:hypothetical protein